MNYMKQLTKMLGVELEEEFKVECFERKYKITDEGIFVNSDNDKWFEASFMLEELLIEGKKIIKLSYQPKTYESYYTYMADWSITNIVWLGNFDDLSNKKCGTVFRTEKDAFNARPEVYKKLTGREWR